MTLRVQAVVYATVQDRGRPGLARIGVPAGGAADPWSLRAANRLCGNDDDAAGLEIALGGIALRAEHDVRAAVVPATPVEVDGHAMPQDRSFVVPAGSVVTIGAPRPHVYAYLCVAGGIDAPVVLGGRGAFPGGGIGRPVRAGDALSPGAARGARAATLAPSVFEAGAAVRVIAGPHDDRFDDDAPSTLLGGGFTVGPRSDRVGRRLDGPRLRHTGPAEIDPSGMVPGAIQVPPDGVPVVLGPDGPVTGGYPVIAVVIAADLATAMQIRPGSPIRFVQTTPDGARAAWLERERRLNEDVRDA